MEQEQTLEIKEDKAEKEKMLERFAKRSSLIRYIAKQRKKGYSLLILICGGQRTGKSIAGIQISKALKFLGISDFDLKLDLKHNVKDFVNWHLEPNSHNRTIITDEAESTLNAIEFWTDFNLAYEKIISTQMYLENIYIVILPMAIRLSKANRRFVDIKIEMMSKRIARWNIVIKRHGVMGFNPKFRAITETPQSLLFRYPLYLE